MSQNLLQAIDGYPLPRITTISLRPQSKTPIIRRYSRWDSTVDLEQAPKLGIDCCVCPEVELVLLNFDDLGCRHFIVFNSAVQLNAFEHLNVQFRSYLIVIFIVKGKLYRKQTK